jgi:hypothetical protein
VMARKPGLSPWAGKQDAYRFPEASGPFAVLGA